MSWRRAPFPGATGLDGYAQVYGFTGPVTGNKLACDLAFASGLEVPGGIRDKIGVDGRWLGPRSAFEGPAGDAEPVSAMFGSLRAMAIAEVASEDLPAGTMVYVTEYECVAVIGDASLATTLFGYVIDLRADNRVPGTVVFTTNAAPPGTLMYAVGTRALDQTLPVGNDGSATITAPPGSVVSAAARDTIGAWSRIVHAVVV